MTTRPVSESPRQKLERARAWLTQTATGTAGPTQAASIEQQLSGVRMAVWQLIEAMEGLVTRE